MNINPNSKTNKVTQEIECSMSFELFNNRCLHQTVNKYNENNLSGYENHNVIIATDLSNQIEI